VAPVQHHAAFRELISASERHGIPIFALASALVALASVSDDSAAADSPLGWPPRRNGA